MLDAPPKGGTQELINYGVLGGIVSGLVAAYLWQRFYRTKLPPYLAFFGGRRLVPIITAVAMMVISVLVSFLYPRVQQRPDQPRRVGHQTTTWSAASSTAPPTGC